MTVGKQALSRAGACSSRSGPRRDPIGHRKRIRPPTDRRPLSWTARWKVPDLICKPVAQLCSGENAAVRRASVSGALSPLTVLTLYRLCADYVGCEVTWWNSFLFGLEITREPFASRPVTVSEPRRMFWTRWAGSVQSFSTVNKHGESYTLQPIQRRSWQRLQKQPLWLACNNDIHIMNINVYILIVMNINMYNIKNGRKWTVTRTTFMEMDWWHFDVVRPRY